MGNRNAFCDRYCTFILSNEWWCIMSKKEDKTVEGAIAGAAAGGAAGGAGGAVVGGLIGALLGSQSENKNNRRY
jgi:hypothetical protein